MLKRDKTCVGGWRLAIWKSTLVFVPQAVPLLPLQSLRPGAAAEPWGAAGSGGAEEPLMFRCPQGADSRVPSLSVLAAPCWDEGCAQPACPALASLVGMKPRAPLVKHRRTFPSFPKTNMNRNTTKHVLY